MIRRCFVDVTDGQVHAATCGTGPPVVLLHQTPRSWDEFREVLPALAAGGARAVALDTIGMGSSSPVAGEYTIERCAAAVVEACDGLGIDGFGLAGHHTGAVVALEVAARAPERVAFLVLSSCPWVDAAARERRRGRAAVDAVVVDDPADRAAGLWRGREPFYPPGRPDLLARFVRDALAVADPAAGHRAVGRYRMEDRIGEVRAPTLCVGHGADPFAFPDLGSVASRIPGATTAVINDGMVPLEWRADAFTALVLEFLENVRMDDRRHSGRTH